MSEKEKKQNRLNFVTSSNHRAIILYAGHLSRIVLMASFEILEGSRAIGLSQDFHVRRDVSFTLSQGEIHNLPCQRLSLRWDKGGVHELLEEGHEVGFVIRFG